MGVQFVTGKLGGGKGKYAVMQLLKAAKEGRRIAGNVDIYLEHFAKKKHRTKYVRVPDKPTARDLEAMGHGNPESYDEDRNGLLVLDELGTWLNARSFSDPARAGVLDWLIHARKHGWDVLLICQNEVQVDKQVREPLGEVFVRCMAMHKIKIPVIGWLLEIFGDRFARLPRFHLASVRVGSGATGFVSERETFRGTHLHPMYDTRQVFKADPDQVAVTQLHPHFFTGLPAARVPAWRRVLAAQRPAPPPSPKPKHPAVQVVMRLPPDRRVPEWMRLQRLGVV
jgi:hypothetical protein